MQPLELCQIIVTLKMFVENSEEISWKIVRACFCLHKLTPPPPPPHSPLLGRNRKSVPLNGRILGDLIFSFLFDNIFPES